MALDLDKGGVAAITGTASGLGRAFALALAKRGWTLELSDIDEDQNRETASLCVAQGATVQTTLVDTSNSNDVRLWCDEIYKRHGRCDLLINNAGVAGAGDVGQMSLELWEWVVNVNLMGPVYGCHHFLPRMRQAESGHIINIASIAAFASGPSMGAYNATKSGVVGLTETLDAELERTPLGATVACPSFFNTAIGKNTKGANAFQQKMLDKLVTQSKISADEIAEDILDAAEDDELYVFPQLDARAMWWVRRLLPTRFGKVMNMALRMVQKKA
jgi:NAD(P)-dependent dehydrogenase (short-subunit alcohol dehydrogenase family)